MPIFEYRCDTCDHDFELLVRNGEQPACPDCGEVHLQKLLSETAVAHVAAGRQSLQIANGCPPGNLPCSPTCCRLP